MSFWNKLLNRKPLAKYEVNTTYHFNDEVHEKFIPDDAIPDIVFDKSLICYHYGFNNENGSYKVFIVTPKKELT